MMGLSHDMVVGIAKSFGLFYLIALSIGICLYAFWPRNRSRFNRAKYSILDDENGPLTGEEPR
ncbi:cbb3-type cytochrome c oxidase subunit 3 [Pontibaca salina]|uniref:Cbb3-type cytochrome c oxidase subunit 3 n=1 Tax=Pontibaca salina TaxID=2795731 RepID=A0A934HLX4_9RHOB|nr:cbb3-type cytochrome c oxidase subunit 3 [Pontibaca salina]MBI6630513.1 cbb3-type cytochrome c oxidase subunit 3 [Pontibaca salina]